MTVVQDLVTAVISEGGFDPGDVSGSPPSSPTVLRWLTNRHYKMVSRSKCYRKTVDIGPTVAGQRDYALGEDVVEIYEVLVGGIPYGRGRHVELAQGARGFLLLDDPDAGLMTAEESATGAREIALFPTPGTSGVSITVRAAWLPGELSVSDDATLRIPPDFRDALIAGGIATGLRRIEQRADLAAPFESEYSDACEELRRQVSRRYRGTGPAQIRVQGYNA